MKWRRIAAVTALATVLTVGGGTAAYADAPTPNMPDRDIGGSLLDFNRAQQTGSCGVNVTFFECYGVSAQFVTDQDTGIVDGAGDRLRAAGNNTANLAANTLMSAAQASTAGLASIADIVYDADGNNFLSALDPIWLRVSQALKTAFTTPFAPFIALIVLLSLIVAAVRGSVSKAVAAFLMALLGVGLVSVGTNYPIKAGQLTDSIVSTTTTTVRTQMMPETAGSSTPGYAMVGGIADQIIYQRWVAGELGDSTSPTAVKYGPILYAAQAYSWTEAAQVRADPDGAGKTILAAKQKQWNDAKAAIKDSDPDAYAYLTGEKGDANRIGQALMMNLTWLVACPMLLVSLVLTALSFLLIRVLVVFLPILGLLMIIPRFHGIGKTVGEVAAACVFNSIIFGGIASMTAVVNTFIMATPDWNPIVKLFLAGLFTGVMWFASHPFRKLTRLVSNYDPMRGLGGSIAGLIGSLKTLTTTVAVGAVTGGVGGIVAGNVVAEGEEAKERELPNNGFTGTAYAIPDSYTRPDQQQETYPVFDASPVVERPALPADAGTVDVESWYTTAPDYVPVGAPERPQVEAPITVTPNDVSVPETGVAVPPPLKDAYQLDDETYVVYDGGRYVIESGDDDREAGGLVAVP